MLSEGGTTLSFHGGGYLGYFSALLARELERYKQEEISPEGNSAKLVHSFDLVAGTSVGSILAAAVAAEIDMSTVVTMMKDHGKDIFKSSCRVRRFPWDSLPGFLGARFASNPLQERLEGVFGDKRLRDIDVPLFIPAINESKGEPVTFTNLDPEYSGKRLVDVVMASAAAPSYFPMHVLNGERYADGGLVSNSPEMISVAHAFETFALRPDKHSMISVGTTRTLPASKARKSASPRWGVIRWMWRRRLLDLILVGQTGFQGEMLERAGLRGNLQLNTILPDEAANVVSMVRADDKAREILEEAARNAWEKADKDRLKVLLGRNARKLEWNPAFNRWGMVRRTTLNTPDGTRSPGSPR